MYRKAINYLKEWKKRTTRKPLVIRGARQVGKTYLIREFSKEYDNYLEINLETDYDVIQYFKSENPLEIIEYLALHFNIDLKKENSLLFLDEIQAAPEIFAKLRYFYEKIPELHIIAAGSLLEFVLEDHEFSMPVGRIEYMHLGPISFEEFLIADGNDKLVEFLNEFNINMEIPEPIHNKLLKYFKIFLTVGGMPESIKTFLENKSYIDSDRIKQNILSTYIDDFRKYGKRVNHQHTLTVFKAIPNIIGKKIKYSNISKDIRAKDISKSIHMLSLAKICYGVHHSSCSGIPLGATINPKIYKLLFLDVGLLCSACGLSMLNIDKAENLMLVNSGSICEQFVGQHLLYRKDYFYEPELFYWIREKSSSNAEIDFVLSNGMNIVPFEVKSGKTGSLKSLNMFVHNHKLNFAVRVNLDKPSIIISQGKLPTGEQYQYNLLSIPCYMIEQFDRLVNNLKLK